MNDDYLNTLKSLQTKALSEEEGEDVSVSIMQDIVRHAEDLMISNHLDRIAIPCAVQEVVADILGLVHFIFLPRDPGDIVGTGGAWECGEEPLPPQTDSWARGVVPVHSPGGFGCDPSPLPPPQPHPQPHRWESSNKALQGTLSHAHRLRKGPNGKGVAQPSQTTLGQSEPLPIPGDDQPNQLDGTGAAPAILTSPGTRGAGPGQRTKQPPAPAAAAPGRTQTATGTSTRSGVRWR